jgi:hypothetical protein
VPEYQAFKSALKKFKADVTALKIPELSVSKVLKMRQEDLPDQVRSLGSLAGLNEARQCWFRRKAVTASSETSEEKGEAAPPK